MQLHIAAPTVLRSQIHAATKPVQVIEAAGPFAEAGVGVDVAGFAEVDEIAAPACGPAARARKCNPRVVAAGDHAGRELQLRLQLRFHVEACGIGGCDQQRAGDQAGLENFRAHGGEAAEAVRDYQRGLIERHRGFDDAARPAIEIGRVPVALLHTAEIGVAALPQALPMAFAATAQARHHQHGAAPIQQFVSRHFIHSFVHARRN